MSNKVTAASMGFWDRIQEIIPGLWRLFALGRKARDVSYKVCGDMTFSWPMYDMRRYFLNQEPRKLYRRQRERMAPSPVQQRVINELTEQGICVIQFNDLFPHDKLSHLQGLAETWVQKPANQTRIKAIEGGARPADEQDKKFYLVRLLGYEPVFDLKDKFMELSLSDKILGIVCGYLGMFSRLAMLDLWYNLPTDGPHVFSQRWHRDPDDRKQLKLFLYLRDVNEANGPFCYIPGSHNGGRFKGIYPQTIRISNYPPDGAVERKFSKNQIQVCTGRAGTIILSDTTGFHKGGAPTREGRLLFTAGYTTNAGVPLIRKERCYSMSELQSDFISPAAEYAISYLKE